MASTGEFQNAAANIPEPSAAWRPHHLSGGGSEWQIMARHLAQRSVDQCRARPRSAGAGGYKGNDAGDCALQHGLAGPPCDHGAMGQDTPNRSGWRCCNADAVVRGASSAAAAHTVPGGATGCFGDLAVGRWRGADRPPLRRGVGNAADATAA